MLKVYDYHCISCGTTTEHFTRGDVPVVNCDCGHIATKQLSAPICKLEGTTGSFPGAHLRWAEKRAEKQRIQERKARDHGDTNW